MYVLVLDLPFEITLVYRQIFISKEEIAEFIKGHPYPWTVKHLTELLETKPYVVPLKPIRMEEK